MSLCSVSSRCVLSLLLSLPPGGRAHHLSAWEVKLGPLAFRLLPGSAAKPAAVGTKPLAFGRQPLWGVGACDSEEPWAGRGWGGSHRMNRGHLPIRLPFSSAIKLGPVSEPALFQHQIPGHWPCRHHRRCNATVTGAWISGCPGHAAQMICPHSKVTRSSPS